MTRAEGAATSSPLPPAGVSNGARWLPPGVPPTVRFVARLGAPPNKLIITLVIALLLHLPFMPFSRFFTFGLFDWLFDETEETDEEAVVPLDLELEESLEEAEPAQKEKVTEAATPEPGGEAIVDAGVDASKGIEDAGPDASKDGGPVDAGPDAPPPPTPKEQEPLAKNQAVKTLSSNPNNVQIVLVGSRLREHPVGVKLGGLLPTIKQWEPFFKDTGINPVDDIDVMIITGPQVRASGDVIAIMKFNGDMAKVEAVVQGIAEKSDGEKLEETPVPAWKATADRGARIFAVVPEKKLLYVIPWPKPTKKDKEQKLDKDKEAWAKEARRRADAQLARIKAAKFQDFSKEKYAIDAYMIEPYKLVSKTGEVELGPVTVQLIPKTLKSMRLRVTPNGGDADVSITFQAIEKDDAELAMMDLKSSWPLLQLAAKSEGLELPDLTWEVEGDIIEGKATLPQAALEKVFELGQKHAEEVKNRKK